MRKNYTFLLHTDNIKYYHNYEEIQLYQKKDVGSMATISITTDYKFTQKSAQKLLNAMDFNESKRINKTNVNATKIKTEDEINDILKGYQDN